MSRTGVIEERIVKGGTLVKWSVSSWGWDWVMGVSGTVQIFALRVDVILKAAIAGFEHSCR